METAYQVGTLAKERTAAKPHMYIYCSAESIVTDSYGNGSRFEFVCKEHKCFVLEQLWLDRLAVCHHINMGTLTVLKNNAHYKSSLWSLFCAL